MRGLIKSIHCALGVTLLESPREECELNAMSVAKLPWKPAVQRGWPAHQVEVVGFVDGQRFMDVTVRVDVCSHGAVQRQAAENISSVILTQKHPNEPLDEGMKQPEAD